jgi:hypothetical protein
MGGGVMAALTEHIVRISVEEAHTRLHVAGSIKVVVTGREAAIIAARMAASAARAAAGEAK